MKAYLLRVGQYLLVFTVAVAVILLLIGGFVLWVKVQEWLIPVDITYRMVRQIAYVVVSFIILFSLLMAIEGDK